MGGGGSTLRRAQGSPTVSALCVGSDDVGLELLASLILLCLSIARARSALRSACAKLVLFFQEVPYYGITFSEVKIVKKSHFRKNFTIKTTFLSTQCPLRMRFADQIRDDVKRRE